MNLNVFMKLVSVFIIKHLLLSIKSCSVEQQVLIFLYITRQNTSNHNVQECFQYSRETISYYFNFILQALITLAPEYIRYPNPSIIPSEISMNPKFFPYFKDCISIIDGTHIPISIPIDQQASF